MTIDRMYAKPEITHYLPVSKDPIILVRAIARFGVERGYWPSRRELVKYGGRVSKYGPPKYGQLTQVAAILRRLLEANLIEKVGTGGNTSWRPTLAGFDRIGRIPFAPPPSANQSRIKRKLGTRRKTAREANRRRRAATLRLLEFAPGNVPIDPTQDKKKPPAVAGGELEVWG